MTRLDDQDRAVRRFRRRAATVLALRTGLFLAAMWLLAWGAAILILRGGFAVDRPALLWGLVGLLPVAVAAATAGILKRPAPAAVRAALDGASRAGGLVMAAAERDLGPWADHVPAPMTPTLRWRSGRVWALVGIGVAFVGLALLIPARMGARGRRPLDVGAEVAELRAQITVLDEEHVVEPEEAEAWAESLKHLAAEASGREPGRTWQALDHLGDALREAARRQAEQDIRHAEDLARAESLARALERDGGALSPESLSEALRVLREDLAGQARESQALRDCLAKHGGCQGGSGNGLRDALENLSAADGRRLAEALKECKSGCCSRVARLAESRLVPDEMTGQCAGAGRTSDEGLADFLADASAGSTEEAIQDWLAGVPGRGGVDRGRGDAPMTWKDPSTDEGVTFEAQVLPPALALEQSRTVGVSLQAPEVAEALGPAPSGALEGAEAGGGSAHTRTLLPRHRNAVERYFERDAP